MGGARALLLVDHGSRVEAANALVADLADVIRARRPDWIVECAHMEVVPPTVLDGISACCNAGASDVIVHPYFLGSGRHTSETIPELIAEARVAHPGVRIRASAPLGPDDALVELVLRRIDAVDAVIDDA
jgi:sirohydrochlorin ferrochelatase